MNHEERLVADFHGTGLTVGPHPMAYRRDWLNAMGIRRASELRDIPNGKRLRIGGCVITRQRPGTAKGFVFFSLEDETGVANAIITPDLFHQNRLLLASERFLAIEGILQNQDNVISVKAERVLPLFVTKAETEFPRLPLITDRTPDTPRRVLRLQTVRSPHCAPALRPACGRPAFHDAHARAAPGRPHAGQSPPPSATFPRKEKSPEPPLPPSPQLVSNAPR